MKKQTQITITVASLVASLIIWVAFPLSLYGPVIQANTELDDYEILCIHIAKFKDNAGMLPRSFEEIGKYSDDYKNFFMGLAKKHGGDGKIHSAEDLEVVFVIEAIWECNPYDNLLWAKTKDGHLIRIPKCILKQ